MAAETDYESMSLAEQIRSGLGDAIAEARGKLTLRTSRRVAAAPELGERRVVRIRKKTGMSQAMFAGVLNVPTKTLQSWEQGARRPKAGEARLLQLIESDPDAILKLIANFVPTHARTARTSKSGPDNSTRRRAG